MTSHRIGATLEVYRSSYRVDSGRGQNRTLTPLWPPVFASEQDVGPPKNESKGTKLERESQPVMPPRPDMFDVVGQRVMAQQSGFVRGQVGQGGAVRKGTVYRTLNRRLSPWRTILPPTEIDPRLWSHAGLTVEPEFLGPYLTLWVGPHPGTTPGANLHSPTSFHSGDMLK